MSIQPSRALGYVGVHPLAARKRALLTRKERVSDVERWPSKSAARPGTRSHAASPAAASPITYLVPLLRNELLRELGGGLYLLDHVHHHAPRVHPDEVPLPETLVSQR